MNVFLTGATGFIGAHVMRQLVERGERVVVLSRRGWDSPHLRDVDRQRVQVVAGDLVEPETYRDAVGGCDAVIHIAGWISTRKADVEKLHMLNVTATARLWDVCREKGTQRIVYLASIFAHGRGRGDAPCDESVSFDEGILALPVPYFRAKRQAELMTWQRVREQALPVVFGYPGFCIGPGDYYLSSMQVVRDFLRGKVAAFVEGGMSFIDVRDAAAGLVACLDRGAVGEKYLLCGHNLRWSAFFDALARVSGRPAPRLRVPPGAARIAGRLVEAMAPRRGPATEGDVAVMAGTWFYDSSKARRELGLPSRPLEASLRDGISWLRTEGFVG